LLSFGVAAMRARVGPRTLLAVRVASGAILVAFGGVAWAGAFG